MQAYAFLTSFKPVMMIKVLFQSDLYVESRNGKLTSAVIPPTFQNCTREGIRPGCLFKFDLPYKQCSQNRTGILSLSPNILEIYCAIIIIIVAQPLSLQDFSVANVLKEREWT